MVDGVASFPSVRPGWVRLVTVFHDGLLKLVIRLGIVPSLDFVLVAILWPFGNLVFFLDVVFYCFRVWVALVD